MSDTKSLKSDEKIEKKMFFIKHVQYVKHTLYHTDYTLFLFQWHFHHHYPSQTHQILGIIKLITQNIYSLHPKQGFLSIGLKGRSFIASLSHGFSNKPSWAKKIMAE